MGVRESGANTAELVLNDYSQILEQDLLGNLTSMWRI